MTLVALFFFSTAAHAVKLTDYQPFQYEVLFTNPICREYKYAAPEVANNGQMLTAKPKNVYCKTSDLKASAARPESPQYRLLEWIKDEKTTEIFMAYLSFSNSEVAKELCNAVKRGATLNIVLDNGAADTGEGQENDMAEGLKKCTTKEGLVKVHYRGNEGSIGFAHNKLFVVNPKDAKVFKMVFSSGNMSSGTAIHHENWNFITTSQASYFAQAHQCLMKAVIEHGKTKADFTAFLTECRGQITAQEETDIRSYFVPADGTKAFNAMKSYALKAKGVEIAAHRFSGKFLSLARELKEAGKTVKLVTDDDIYWSAKLNVDTGRNTVGESLAVMKLKNEGIALKFMQTNHAHVLLQHNKFMVMDMGNDKTTVFAGAGNLTSAAVSSNFENFYLIHIPEVTAKFKTQYAKFWNEMATAEELMPRENALP